MAKAKNEASLVDQLERTVLESILTGELDIENHLITEKALMERFSCSKSTVREALLRLCNSEVLKSIPRSGYMVVRINNRKINEIVKFRILLETGSLMECYHKITDRDIARLRDHLKKYPETAGTMNVWDIWQLNIEFHEMLIGFSDNLYYMKLLNDSLNLQKRAFALECVGMKSDMLYRIDSEPHKRICNAIESGNIDEAILQLRTDIQSGEILTQIM